MSIPRIAGFLFDEENEHKILTHGLSARRVLQLLDNEHVVVPNRKGRRGIYLMIGRDNGGAFITVPVEPTHDHTLWRPITAWLSQKHERARLGPRGRR